MVSVEDALRLGVKSMLKVIMLDKPTTQDGNAMLANR